MLNLPVNCVKFVGKTDINSPVKTALNSPVKLC